jgi:hypothetical protein
MTLVLAVIRGEEIHLMADTLISFDARLGQKPYHALKILSLSSTTVLAFSGGHEHAMRIFFNLFAARAHELQIFELAKLIEELRSKISSGASSDEAVPDFLIACTTPNACVYRINDHGVSMCSSYSWIGNPQAAAYVAKHIVANVQFDVASVFRQIVCDSLFNDVGGYVVEMRGSRAGFKFTPYLRLVSPRYIPAEGWNSVDFGNAESGGYGLTSITPCKSGHNGYGIFFFQGRFGHFFHVDPTRKIGETLTAYASSSSEFVKIIEDEVGFALEHCGSLG